MKGRYSIVTIDINKSGLAGRYYCIIDNCTDDLIYASQYEKMTLEELSELRKGTKND